MNQCEVCGRPAELHHIVFKSAAKHMQHVPVNFKYLCPEHHRGNSGPHLNRKVDIQYKLEMQKKLFEMLPKDIYSEEELQQILEVSKGEVQALVKILKRYKEGFDRTELVLRMMGGRLYAK